MTELVVPRSLIQPVCPFGRPGNRTSSHGPYVPRTGSVVRSPVIGVRAGTTPTDAVCVDGFECACCGASSVTRSWVAVTRGVDALACADAVAVEIELTDASATTSRAIERARERELPALIR